MLPAGGGTHQARRGVTGFWPPAPWLPRLVLLAVRPTCHCEERGGDDGGPLGWQPVLHALPPLLQAQVAQGQLHRQLRIRVSLQRTAGGTVREPGAAWLVWCWCWWWCWWWWGGVGGGGRVGVRGSRRRLSAHWPSHHTLATARAISACLACHRSHAPLRVTLVHRPNS